MEDKSCNKKPFHLIATEVLDDDNNVTGYSITSPEYPSVDAFCERAEDIIQTGWEAKEKAAACGEK